MPQFDSTDWQLIFDAAGGQTSARNELARRYLTPVTAYFATRWRSNQLLTSVDDAVQEVFVDLFRQRGVLERASPDLGAFRALLFGTARVVALRFEDSAGRQRERPAPSSVVRAGMPDDEDAARAFDRAWAQNILAEARERQAFSTASRYRLVVSVARSSAAPMRRTLSSDPADSNSICTNCRSGRLDRAPTRSRTSRSTMSSK